jgi:hypothetical protein
MTRLEKVINAVNWKYPGEIPPMVAKHLVEMDGLYQFLTYGEALEISFSRNGAERRGDIHRSTLRQERQQVVHRLAAYQKTRELTIYSLASAIFAKTGKHVNQQSLRNWLQNASLPADRSAKLIKNFLDIADDQGPGADPEKPSQRGVAKLAGPPQQI